MTTNTRVADEIGVSSGRLRSHERILPVDHHQLDRHDERAPLLLNVPRILKLLDTSVYIGEIALLAANKSAASELYEAIKIQRRQVDWISCSHEGRVEDVMAILRANTISANGIDHDGRTSLSAAASSGHLGLLEKLLNHGCDPNFRVPCEKFGTALHAATKKGHLECVELLIRCGVDVLAEDLDGQTALDLCSLSLRVDACRGLIRPHHQAACAERDMLEVKACEDAQSKKNAEIAAAISLLDDRGDYAKAIAGASKATTASLIPSVTARILDISSFDIGASAKSRPTSSSRSIKWKHVDPGDVSVSIVHCGRVLAPFCAHGDESERWDDAEGGDSESSAAIVPVSEGTGLPITLMAELPGAHSGYGFPVDSFIRISFTKHSASVGAFLAPCVCIAIIFT